jgi:asparagine synthase (glutamine-hydrolysing)
MTEKAKIYEFLDPEAVQTFVKEHLTGQKNRRLFIWSLLNLEALLDK